MNNELLLAVFAIQNPSHNIACNNHAMSVIEKLIPKGCTVVRNKGNMLVRKGPASGPHPYFLAHMDQVHDYVPFMQLVSDSGILSARDGNGNQVGVGGDDKCGIYLALDMLHRLDHCTAVFVRDEEVGCIGSGEVPLEWFDHASFVIQADRNNQTFDIIRDTNGYRCASDAFMDEMLKLPEADNHSETSGSVTDIGELTSRGLTVSMVNISSGYHNPHSRKETVTLSELQIACDLAYAAATTLGDRRWYNKPESCWGDLAGYSGLTTGDDWSRDFEWEDYRALGEAYPTDDERERLISGLIDCGFDRGFDQMDHFTTEELSEWLAESIALDDSLADA